MSRILVMILLLCTLTKQYKAKRKSDGFSCVGKVIGGYYADVQSGCQMFHVCTLDQNVELQDIVFRCISGTVFEQETRVCERQEEVSCDNSEDFYYLNNELYGPGIIPRTAMNPEYSQSSISKEILDPTDVLKSPVTNDTKLTLMTNPPTLYQTQKSGKVVGNQIRYIQKHFHKRKNLTVIPSENSYMTRKPPAINNSPPYIVTRTASTTSVSASSRVHIETPVSRFTLQRGYDFSNHPAPHLRPSLLKFAAEGRSGLTYNPSRIFASLPPIKKRRIRNHRLSRSLKLFTPMHQTNVQQPSLPKSYTNFPYSRNYNSSNISGYVIAINGVITKPNDFQTYMTNLKSDYLIRRSRPTPTRSNDTPKENISLACYSNPRKKIYADVELGCILFPICSDHKDRREMKKESYICSKNGLWFDESAGKCLPTFPSMCRSFGIMKSSTTFRIKGHSEKSLLDLCKYTAHNGSISGRESNCNQYFNCKVTNGLLLVEIYKCNRGLSFSTMSRTCLDNYENKCNLTSSQEADHHKGDIGATGEILNVRLKRSSLFEKHNSQRESNSGPLSMSDGIFSDHASVIDNPSAGNIVIARSDIQRKDKYEENYPTAITPQNSVQDQTSRNETVVEVSEMSSPDQHGKVTITSIVPKFVSFNGNTRLNDTEIPLIPTGIQVSSFQSKVIFSSGNSTSNDDYDDKNITNMADLTNEFGNESMHDKEVGLQPDSIDLSNSDSNSSTVDVTTLKTTKIMKEITTKLDDIDTVETTTAKSIPDKKLSTKLSQSEIIETNFTCRDKELERFYPDIEAECKVFHYCAPGFSEDQVLDLKFLCTGDTIFDSGSSKCRNENEVKCEIPKIFHGLTTTERSNIARKSTRITSTVSPFGQLIETESTTPLTQNSTILSASSSRKTSDPITTSHHTSTSTINIDTSFSSISTDTNTEPTIQSNTEEEVSKYSVTKPVPTDTITISSSQTSDIQNISSKLDAEVRESSTASNIFTSPTTSYVSTEDNVSQVLSENTTMGTTIEMLSSSMHNTEDILIAKEQTVILENVTFSTEETLAEVVNEEFANNNLSIITAIIENDTNISLQLLVGNMTVVDETLLNSNQTGMDEFVPVNGGKSLGSKLVGGEIMGLHTSMQKESGDDATMETEQPKSGIEIEGKLNTDINIEYNISTENITTVLIAK